MRKRKPSTESYHISIMCVHILW